MNVIKSSFVSFAQLCHGMFAVLKGSLVFMLLDCYISVHELFIEIVLLSFLFAYTCQFRSSLMYYYHKRRIKLC